MKKLLKSALAFALCLALVAVIVPASVFASGFIKPRQHKTGDVILGSINLMLKEQYYQYGGPYLDLREILPEIEIESYSDLALGPILAGEQTNPGHKHSSSIILSRVGAEFNIVLTEKTLEATMKAVELLNNNPYVKSVGPNRYAVLSSDWDFQYEVTVNDALGALRIAAGLAPATLELVDFYDYAIGDGDGKVTVNDALMVLRIAAGLA